MDSTLKSSSSNSSREELLRSTKELCNVFANHGTIEEIISCFSSKGQSNTPFIGRSFYGIQGITDYFTIISNTLEYENMYFYDYTVDIETKVVSVRGKAKFIWKSTKKYWNEIFIYRIQLDNEYKILIYEVWADTGAAYLASQSINQARV
ncbi:hypothetical protein FRACYDRAFT_249480 [Fragilariopsis cylindrus CCMP1102]|uniref:SnoaL-like domain-containing protein n=1 Tax=Fragilariopsis cylindrus CCMP1102 TaxID=635003 RepID=A0A1E7ERX1_9STRA|nr:hypothetical protein FRACYDRAFT_249480 [Fragilariopsis cylindrus CCMP1102]|eukprot:OEU08587.1 hypothetical protein FRACYDRAFT_249480 [Fragilariopsis cylindrus CCMP1102]